MGSYHFCKNTVCSLSLITVITLLSTAKCPPPNGACEAGNLGRRVKAPNVWGRHAEKLAGLGQVCDAVPGLRTGFGCPKGFFSEVTLARNPSALCLLAQTTIDFNSLRPGVSLTSANFSVTVAPFWAVAAASVPGPPPACTRVIWERCQR